MNSRSIVRDLVESVLKDSVHEDWHNMLTKAGYDHHSISGYRKNGIRIHHSGAISTSTQVKPDLAANHVEKEMDKIGFKKTSSGPGEIGFHGSSTVTGTTDTFEHPKFGKLTHSYL
jgi:hypothetical protein